MTTTFRNCWNVIKRPNLKIHGKEKKWKMETKVIENEMPFSKNKSIFSKSKFFKRKSNDKCYLETNSDSMEELLHDTLELKSGYGIKKQDSNLLENNTNLKAKPLEYHETSHEKFQKPGRK